MHQKTAFATLLLLSSSVIAHPGHLPTTADHALIHAAEYIVYAAVAAVVGVLWFKHSRR